MLVAGVDRPARRGHDPFGHGGAAGEGQGVADGDDVVTHDQFAGGPELDRRQVAHAGHPHDGDVGVDRRSDHGGVGHPAVVEAHLDARRARDDVVVREHEPVGREDHPRAGAL